MAAFTRVPRMATSIALGIRRSASLSGGLPAFALGPLLQGRLQAKEAAAICRERDDGFFTSSLEGAGVIRG